VGSGTVRRGTSPAGTPASLSSCGRRNLPKRGDGVESARGWLARPSSTRFSYPLSPSHAAGDLSLEPCHPPGSQAILFPPQDVGQGLSLPSRLPCPPLWTSSS